jgi:hypothetical protein
MAIFLYLHHKHLYVCRNIYTIFTLIIENLRCKANFILLPMDETTQKNHLKAYRSFVWALEETIQRAG